MSMDSIAELKYRRGAAEFIQEMADRLNHNIQQHRGQMAKCICVNKKTGLRVCIYLACRCVDFEV
uniref:Uncharacterized protein n=1 Tax=Meloidogyne incognita TaxID=6306 RepID=A0A914L4K3_MELIC